MANPETAQLYYTVIPYVLKFCYHEIWIPGLTEVTKSSSYKSCDELSRIQELVKTKGEILELRVQ